MKRNLKEQILTLRKEGKTLFEIKQTLNCSFSTVAYHLYEKTRVSTLRRINPETKKKYALTTNAILYSKYIQFFRAGHRRKITTSPTFSFEELKQIVGSQPTCYLTGQPINLTEPRTLSLDHKLPVSRGGDNSTDNLGICSSTANRVKSDLTESELIQFCQQVLSHRGYTISKN